MSTMEGQKKKKKFSRKQLRAGQGMLTQQAKTNIYASQAGMTSFGAVRHGRDIAADDLDQAGNCELTQQAKTNIYDSQKGMTCFGAVRHGKDIAVKELFEESDGEYPTDEEDEVKPATRAARSRGEEPAPSTEPEPQPEPEAEAEED